MWIDETDLREIEVQRWCVGSLLEKGDQAVYVCVIELAINRDLHGTVK